VKSQWKLTALSTGVCLSVPLVLPLLFGGGGKLIVYAGEAGWACLILLSAWVLGKKLLAFLYPSHPFAALEAFLVSTGVGLTALIFLFALLGGLNLYYKPVMAGAALLPLAAGFSDLRKLGSLRPGSAPRSGSDEEQLPASVPWLWLLFSLLAGVCLLCALSPIFFYDALAYHLSVPSEWLKAHRIFSLPWNVHSFYPAGFPMLMMPCLVFESGVPAKVLSDLLGVFAALTVYATGKRVTSPLAGILAAMLFLSIPQVVLISNFVQADFASAFFGLLVLFLLVRTMEAGPRRGAFLLAGLFLGVLASLKYSTWIYGATLLVMAMVLALPRAAERVEGPGKRVRLAALFLLLLTTPLLPWLIRDAITTGNPVYPMAYRLFDGKYWSRMQAEDFFSAMGRPVGEPGGPGAWIHVLKALFFHFDELGAFSAVILLSIPVLIFLFVRRKFGRNHGILFAAFLAPFIAWVVTSRNLTNMLRYNLSSLAAAALFLACAAPLILPRKRLSVLTVFVLCIFLADAGYGIRRTEKYLFTFDVTAGTLSRDRFLRRHLAFYPTAEFINRNLPETARVLFAGETRDFYCNVTDFVPSSWNGPWFMELGRNGFQNGFRRLGITHILVNVDELNRMKTQGANWVFKPELAQDFLQTLKGSKILYRDGSILLVEFAKPAVRKPASR
jgi:hypothetical protein